MNDGLYDLHIHSHYSDGTDTVSGLLASIRRRGINAFSITDHNNLEAYSEIKSMNGNAGRVLEYYPGVEVSVTRNNREHHVLVYGRNVDCPGIRNIVKHANDALLECALVLIEAVLGQKGMDDFLAYDFDQTRGGWKSYNFLLDKKKITGLEGYFQLQARYGKRARFVEPEELIETALSGGLYAVLAHPTLCQDGDLMSGEELDYWRESGIAGLECYNLYYKEKGSIDYYLDYCKQNNLLVTGGSDYHGSFLDRPLGNELITGPKLRLGEMAGEYIEL